MEKLSFAPSPNPILGWFASTRTNHTAHLDLGLGLALEYTGGDPV